MEENGEAHEADTDAAQTRLFAFLDDLGIVHSTRRHDPVFTVAEAQSLRDDIAGAHTKNLFLKDKKGGLFLVSLEETADVDLKSIHAAIGARGRVSFGKPDLLEETLGVLPGSVTLLGALNDTDGRVKVVIDAPLMDHDIINAHPLTNTATTSLARDDLVRFLEATGHVPLVLKVSA